MNLQQTYDLERAEDEIAEELDRRIEPYPMNEATELLKARG